MQQVDRAVTMNDYHCMTHYPSTTAGHRAAHPIRNRSRPGATASAHEERLSAEGEVDPRQQAPSQGIIVGGTDGRSHGQSHETAVKNTKKNREEQARKKQAHT